MWRILVNAGIDYIRRHFLPRIKVNAIFAALFDRVLTMAIQVMDKLTDSNPNNTQQLAELWAHNEEELISTLLAGSITSVKSVEAKARLVAILEDTADKLKTQLPVQA